MLKMAGCFELLCNDKKFNVSEYNIRYQNKYHTCPNLLYFKSLRLIKQQITYLFL